VSCSCK